jgi:pSer/pThr/pTyr-binding forkhead associated (FHA) protein
MPPARPQVPAGAYNGNQPIYQGQPAQDATPPTARMLVELDSKVIGTRQLDKQVLTVGRLSSNDIQVPNQRVSRLHAKVRVENGQWVIEDAESVNGIVYKGQRVERHVLRNGDRVYVGPTAVLLYQTAS